MSDPVAEPKRRSVTIGTRRVAPSLGEWLVALAAMLPLLPTLRAAFVYDDTTIIRDNPLLRGWDALVRVWSAPYWPTTGADVSGLYRPLHVAILALLWNAGGGAAWPFHLYALVLHAVVAMAVWWLLRRGVGAFAAGVGALWFATHPLHVETVASAANSAELLVVGCMIALTWLLVRRLSRNGAASDALAEWPAALGCAALTAAAVLSKESGLLALPVAAITTWGWHATNADRRDGVLRSHARLWLAGGAALALALLARAIVLGAPVARVSIAAPGLDVLSPTERIAAMLSLWPRIARMIVWPGLLAPYYGPTILTAQRSGMAALAVLSAVALVTLALVIARRGDRRPIVALAWIALTYLPASNLFAATGQLIADRTLFGATVGAALALAWAVDRVPRRARVALVLVAAIAIARDAVASARYAVTWSSHRTLWERLVEVSPTEPRGYQLLGIDARERGDTARALPLLARAFAMEPRARRNRFEYGQLLYATGRYPQAVQVLAPLIADGDVRREPLFVAMYLDAVGRAHGADAVVTAGRPLLRSESAATAALYVGAAHEQMRRLAAADSVYGVGLRTTPRDSLLLAARASVERRLAPR
ncbi:MAG: tetratricopeptide repeat protein [Gemmatimonadaceae bacterium]